MCCCKSLVGHEGSLLGFAGIPAPGAGKTLPSLCPDGRKLARSGAGGEKIPAAGNFPPPQRPTPTGEEGARVGPGAGWRKNAKLLLVPLTLLLALLPVLCAAAPASVYIEELTWTELRDLVAGGKTIVIIPVGGTEQNGPHMALGKHNVRVRPLAGKIASGLGDALV